MSQPRVRSLSAGPRRGTARPILPAGPWWTRGPRPSSPHSGPAGAAPRPVAWLGEVGRADRHEATLAGAADAMQTAVDEAGVFAAASAALERLGLNAHLATLEPGGAALVVRTVVLPQAAAAEVERILGRPLVGARIDLDVPTPYQTVVRDGRVARVDAPLWWVRLAALPIGRAEADAVAALIRLGDVVLAPIAAGPPVLGVLTIWSATLGEADASTAELLGRMLGGALAAHRARADGRQNTAALAATASAA